MKSSRIITVINGPNLASLGIREPEHYGSATQSELIDLLERKASAGALSIEFFQSDIEGELVRAINQASGRSLGLIINPAAYSHYSIAIMDAMKAFDGPVVEVHISRVFSRESFRSTFVTAEAANVFISGAGIKGYLHAMDILQELAEKTEV
jgi:3-dehydroquinate dehydratase II